MGAKYRPRKRILYGIVGIFALLLLSGCADGDYEKGIALEEVATGFREVRAIVLYAGGEEISLGEAAAGECLALLAQMPFDTCKAYDLSIEKNKERIPPGQDFELALLHAEGQINILFHSNDSKSKVVVSTAKDHAYVFIGNMNAEYKAVYELVGKFFV